jgi:hypothetical protein
MILTNRSRGREFRSLARAQEREHRRPRTSTPLGRAIAQIPLSDEPTHGNLPNVLDRVFTPRRMLAVIGVGCAAAGGGAAVAMSGTGAPARAVVVQPALHGDGIADARFGNTAGSAIHRVRLLLGRKPVEPDAVVNACRIDHAARWPGLTMFFHNARFAGYSYELPKHRTREPELATARGLRVGDTLARAHRLYGAGFERSSAQGGSWSATIRHRRLMGYAHRLPIGPHSTVATIEAGDVGCPAMTP